MGRNKIRIEKINNRRIRSATFKKRNKGLIKKAMELSMLCDSEILLCIVNKSNMEAIIYESNNNLELFLNQYLIKKKDDQLKNFKTTFLSNFDYNDKDSNHSNNSNTSNEIIMRRKNKRLEKKNIFTTEKNISIKEISKSKKINTLKNKLSLKVKIPKLIIEDKKSKDNIRSNNIKFDLNTISNNNNNLNEDNFIFNPKNSLFSNSDFSREIFNLGENFSLFKKYSPLNTNFLNNKTRFEYSSSNYINKK